MRLRAQGLTVAVGARVLCRDLDLTVGSGELWAVLGKNGSGKTTLLHTLAGLVPAAAGTVLLGEKPLATLPARERGRALGVLLQQEDHAYWGSVAEYVMLGRYPHARSLFGANADDEQAVADALAAFGLESLAARAYLTLSGGERQRARLAQLWAQRTDTLLLDEPLQHLDIKHQVRALERLRRGVANDGRSALMVLHDLTYAPRCDRVLMLFGDGRHASGSSAELLQQARIEELYDCRVHAWGNGPDACFIPVI